MRLLRVFFAGATALVLVATASATHDPRHFFSGNWATVVQTPIGQKNGTISFRAVTPAQGEAAIQGMGVSKGQRNQYCWASDPGQYYVGTYNGGIGEGYSLSSSGTPAPPDGTHAGCMEGTTYKAWFKNSNPAFLAGQLRLMPGNGSGIADASSWHYGDFGGTDYFLSGTFTGHFAGDGAEDNPDSDGDGLPDEWETKGYDAGDDGTIDVPLPQMGADPLHKDVFVQLDMMLGHPLQRTAIAKVVSAFANAPVSNPDGKPGITLHVDMGPGTVMRPSGATWGTLSRSGSTPHKEVVGSGSETNYDWSEFEAIKKKNFPAARAPVFRYALSIHRYGSKSQDSGGLGRVAGGDFLIAMGAYCDAGIDCQGTEAEQAGTFMHELGHTLGLRHGGDTNVNYKPNYFSIMNYAFQISGLTSEGKSLLDYSRYRAEGASGGGPVMPNLNENDLSEGDGFGPAAFAVPQFGTEYECNQMIGSAKRKASTRDPIDWNCNGAIDPGRMARDLNGDFSRTVLTSFDDWSNLAFKGGAIGAPGAPAPPRQTPADEASASELVAAARVVLGDAKAPTITVKGKRRIRAKKGRLTITATDGRQVAALTIGDGRKWFQFFAKPNAKRMSIYVQLTRPGVYHLTVSAVDQIGNTSKRKRITAVVGRGARRTAGRPGAARFLPAAGVRREH
jgi:hypothetical protein